METIKPFLAAVLRADERRRGEKESFRFGFHTTSIEQYEQARLNARTVVYEDEWGICVKYPRSRLTHWYNRPHTKVRACDCCGRLRADHYGPHGLRYIHFSLPTKYVRKLFGDQYTGLSADVCISCNNRFKPTARILECAYEAHYTINKLNKEIKDAQKQN